jgi:hypothetical protein
MQTINIPEVTKAQPDWPIIRIPAASLHLVLSSRGLLLYGFDDSGHYELKPVQVQFSQAVIQTEGVQYRKDEPEPGYTCYQYTTDSYSRYQNFEKFCESDQAIKEMRSGCCVYSSETTCCAVIVSASGFSNVFESDIFPWAKRLGAEFIDKETEQPVNVNIIKHESRIR